MGQEMHVLRLVVTPVQAGQRLDRVLAASGVLGSRARVQALLRAGRVQVNGVARKASYVLRPGDAVEAAPERPTQASTMVPEAEARPLDILYEDEDVLVVNKPPGVVVHPAPGHRSGTLVNALLHHVGGGAAAACRAGLDSATADGSRPGQWADAPAFRPGQWADAHTFRPGQWADAPAFRPGIVHRLDKDTSGVLVVAKSPAAHEHLARQFRERTVAKEYLAVVRGRMPGSEGVIDRPIGRHPRERQRMSVRTRRGRAALTRYAVRDNYGVASVVRLFPTTGRTHQLRVHLAAVGHPIVGDQVYGRWRLRGRAVPGSAADALAHVTRQALHAARLEFTHPRSGTRMRLRAPLPRDLQDLVAVLRAEYGAAA